MEEMPEVKREFSGGFMGFFSFFKRPEVFKAGLLLLEILSVQRWPNFCLAVLSLGQGNQRLRAFAALYGKGGVRCSNYKCSSPGTQICCPRCLT